MKQINYKTFLLILLIIFSGLQSCKKKSGTYTIEGKITDESTSQSIGGATVQLYYKNAGAANEFLMSTTTSASDGTYSFTFKYGKYESYRVVVSKTNYFEAEKTIYNSSLTLNSSNTYNISTTSMAWVKLTFLNQNPDSADQLMVDKQYGKSDCVACCTDYQIYFDGAVDTSYYCVTDGNSLYQYYYSATGSNVVSGTKSVTALPFDTTEIVLVY